MVKEEDIQDYIEVSLYNRMEKLDDIEYWERKKETMQEVEELQLLQLLQLLLEVYALLVTDLPLQATKMEYAGNTSEKQTQQKQQKQQKQQEGCLLDS